MLCRIAACVAAILCLLTTSCASQASVRVIRATAHTATGTAAPGRASLQACSRSPVPGFSCTRPAVTVTPSGRLRTGQRVMVRVTGFAIGGKVFLSECAASADANAAGCGPQLAAQPALVTGSSRSASGTFTVSSRAAAGPNSSVQTLECADHCVVVATLGLGPAAGYAYARIIFARKQSRPICLSRVHCRRRAHPAHAEGLSAASYFSACGSPLPMPSRAAIASAGSVRLAAATFSRRCASDEVPGISAIVAERCSSHASAT